MTLRDELIEAIRNENNYFGMAEFVKGDSAPGPGRLIHGSPDLNVPASCQTASCMAGWIVALRPELAQQLADTCRVYREGKPRISHEQLASKIWEHETGERCPLDFISYNYHGKFLADITREDAIQHIQGIHPDWPQLGE